MLQREKNICQQNLLHNEKKCSNRNKNCLRTKFVPDGTTRLQKEQKMFKMKIAPNWTQSHDFKMAL